MDSSVFSSQRLAELKLNNISNQMPNNTTIPQMQNTVCSPEKKRTRWTRMKRTEDGKDEDEEEKKLHTTPNHGVVSARLR